MQARELHDLPSDYSQGLQCRLIRRSPVLGNRGVLGVHRAAEGGGPSAKGVSHLAQLVQGRHRRLPAVRDRDASDRPPIKVRALITGQILEVVQGVLHHAADPAVVPGTGNEQAISTTSLIDETTCGVGALGTFGVVDRQHEIPSGDTNHGGTSILGGTCRDLEGAL